MSQSLKRDDEPEMRLKVTNFDLAQFPTVKLDVQVTDSQNYPLMDVELDKFVVLEGNESPIRIALRSHTNQKPMAASIAMGYSASMTKGTISNVEAATRYFLDKLQPNDFATIVKFAKGIDVAQALTRNNEELSICNSEKSNLPIQDTALYESIIQGVDQLKLAKNDLRDTIVNTDGENTGGYGNYHRVTNHARHNGQSIRPA